MTGYAEGLACKNFQLKNKYHVRRVGSFNWMVMFKEIGKKIDRTPDMPIKFDRVREVKVDTEGYMSCSCGYVQRMLMPCRHICAVLENIDNYVPSLFHIRWHKLYSYYYRNLEESDLCLNISSALNEFYDTTKNVLFKVMVNTKEYISKILHLYPISIHIQKRKTKYLI